MKDIKNVIVPEWVGKLAYFALGFVTAVYVFAMGYL